MGLLLLRQNVDTTTRKFRLYEVELTAPTTTENYGLVAFVQAAVTTRSDGDAQGEWRWRYRWPSN